MTRKSSRGKPGLTADMKTLQNIKAPVTGGASTYTLIIWEEIPERTRLLLVPDSVADEHRGDLKMAHGRYINQDEDNPGLTLLNWALCDPQYKADAPSTIDQEDVGGFLQYEVELNKGAPLQDVAISSVVHSGFRL